VIGAATGALLVVSLIPSVPALAAPCFSQPLNTVTLTVESRRGIKVSNPGMGVFDGNVDCSRVSSVLVYNSLFTRAVEIGWYEDPANNYVCVPTTSGSPKILAFAYDGNDRFCWGNPTGTGSDATDPVEVHDANQNAIWVYKYDGSQVWTGPDLGSFTNGTLAGNGERGNEENTSHADFDGLKGMNHNQKWVATQGFYEAGESLSDDPGARPCFYSDTHTAVKLNGTPC
jgi:hypothetical protein